MKPLPILVLVFLWPIYVTSQNMTYGKVKGRVLDAEKHFSIVSATVSLFPSKDSTKATYIVQTDNNGYFKFEKVPFGNYRLDIRYIGFIPRSPLPQIIVSELEVDYGDIFIQKQPLELRQIEVLQTRMPILIKRDTIEFRAEHYKTKETSAMEDLLRKLPGAEIASDGSIKINGKEVKEILIDGKPFFGSSTQLASRNLMSGIVDKIQVLDYHNKYSNGQVRAGEDIDQGKSINIIVKKDLYGSINGLVSVGSSIDSKFATRANFNKFGEHQHISILTSGNNVNGFEDNREPLSNELSTWNAGFDLNKDFNDKLSLATNYLFSNDRMLTIVSADRQNIFPDSTTANKQSSSSLFKNSGHNLNIDLSYKLDSLSTLSYSGVLSFSNSSGVYSNSFSALNGSNRLLNEGSTINNTSSNSDFFLTMINYTKRFKKGRQALNVQFKYSHGNILNENINFSKTVLYQGAGEFITDTLNQNVSQNNSNSNTEGSISFVTPISKYLSVNLDHRYTILNSMSGKSAQSFDYVKGQFILPIDSISGDVTIRRSINISSIGFKVRRNAWELSLGGNMFNFNQQVLSRFLQPSATTMGEVRFFPSVLFNWNFKKNQVIHFDYSQTLQPPNTKSVFPLPDNSNPTYYFKGNVNLRPTKADVFNLNYSLFGSKIQYSLNVNGQVEFINDQMVNATSFDSVGKQIAIPVNVDGFVMSNIFISNSIPIVKDKLRMGSNSSFNNSRSYSIINDQRNRIKSYSISQSLTFNLALSKMLDLGGYAGITHSRTVYSAQPDNIIRYNTYFLNIDVSISLPIGFEVGGNFKYTKISDQIPGFSQDRVLLNGFISKSILRNQRGLIKVNGFDILDRNVNISRISGDGFIQTTNSTPMKRFFLLTFTYFLKPKS